MPIFCHFDPALFGAWSVTRIFRRSYGREAAAPEVKSAADPPEQLRRLLNAMTVEMRAQFAAFRRLRKQAKAGLAGDDEAAGKLARADVKAATDAMALIVRTLEKIDALQRQLALDRDRDREAEAEREAGSSDYAEARERLLKLIDEKAHAKAKLLHAEWLRHGASPADARAEAATAAEPGDTAAPEGDAAQPR